VCSSDLVDVPPPAAWLDRGGAAAVGRGVDVMRCARPTHNHMQGHFG